MQFYEKLDFLMNITKTTNSTLSLYISLDASYISRLRRGERRLSKKGTYAKSMAAYFAKHCNDGYQRKALFDILNTVPFSCEDSKLFDLILEWILNDKERTTGPVENFLDGFVNIRAKEIAPADDDNVYEFPSAEVSVYYGVNGKRQAVIHFLSEVIARKKSQTLYLFSDEPADWMISNQEFANKWTSLMSQALVRGNRIKIIHTISRDLEETLNAISQWMPFYMIGAMEPYFYPKKRDGVFKRTLFIAPDTAAVVSSSIGSMYDRAVNLLFRNKPAVDSFMEEYSQYLSLCKPLMRIFKANDQGDYLKTLFNFEKEQVDTIIKTESLSFLTMPETLAAGIIQRNDIRKEHFLEYHKLRILNFRRNLQSNSFTEIIQLPETETVKSGKVKIAYSDMLGGGSAYYTAQEYILHLESLVQLLKNYDNFHVCISGSTKEDGYMVYAREALGAIAVKTSAPHAAIAISENNMAAAFWDFLKSKTGKNHSLNNSDAANKLCDFIQRLKD